MSPSSVEIKSSVQEVRPVRVVREPRLVERVVFVGGHPGCGKTMMTPIVGSLARVEVQRFNYALEHLCGLALLGKLDEASASALIRMQCDIDLYNGMMSRETNFRPSDLSSVFRNPGTWRYLRRLFGPGDAVVLERIRSEKPILHMTLHNCLFISPPLFKALGPALRILEVVRHPLYMIKQWHLYIERYGTDVREFTLWFEAQGRSLPFFAHGWEDLYLASNPMDRVIYSIRHLSQSAEHALRILSDSQRGQVLRIPFERFVLDPWPYLKQLEVLLGTQATPLTRRELRRQRVPRKRIADGIPLPIYKLNGWEASSKGDDEREALRRRREYAAGFATPEGMKVLDQLSEQYEQTYGWWR